MPLSFTTNAPLIDLLWRRALSGLDRNIITIAGRRVLTVAPGYPGIWLEHAPHEGLLYSDIDPEIASANHELFLDQQREDGQLPCYHLMEKHHWPAHIPQVGFGQVQSIVSITRTGAAWCARSGDLCLAARLFEGGVRWDAWFARHRDSAKLGLAQAFCVFDTGHDNSWRFGVPPQAVENGCPARDATRCNTGHELPWYVPDLSASRLELRQGLVQLARLLGRADEAAHWEAQAAASSAALREHLYDAEDAFFYDRDATGAFRRFRTEAAFHPLRAGVLTQAEFDRMWARHLGNPSRFWTPTAFPSVAADDPAFNGAFPPNSWSGAAQALTILRTPLWMERYERTPELLQILAHWRDLLASAAEFRQEANPFTGELHPRTTPNYAGSLFVAVEAIQRLHGVHRQADGLIWNCQLPPGATSSEFTLDAPDVGRCTLLQQNGSATLLHNQRVLAEVRGSVRIHTQATGAVTKLENTGPKTVTIDWAGRQWTIAPRGIVHA
jgi:hypothetical protein